MIEVREGDTICFTHIDGAEFEDGIFVGEHYEVINYRGRLQIEDSIGDLRQYCLTSGAQEDGDYVFHLVDEEN